jgi:tRNA threonylcarbamoyladenosine biosynthesis protein TsaE
MAVEQTITTNSPQKTMDLGAAIGRQLKGGEVFALVGPLGSGKTHLIKGLAAGVGATDRTEVNSPTFVIINEYQGRLRVYHIDAYRITSLAEFEMLGFDDLLSPDSVVVVEWADKVEGVVAQTHPIRIELRHEGRTRRTIVLRDLPSHIQIA